MRGGPAAEGNHLHEAAGGATRRDEKLIFTTQDEHLGLFVWTDLDDVVFLKSPFAAEFVGEFVDDVAFRSLEGE